MPKKYGSAEKTNPTKTQIPGMGVCLRAPDSTEELLMARIGTV